MPDRQPIVPTPSLSTPRRRLFLGQAGAVTLSAGALLLLGGCGSRAVARVADTSAQDASILDAALAAEYQAIAAYELGAASGLLQPPVLKLATTFRDQHQAHAELLANTVRTLGATPSEPLERYEFPVDSLKDQADVLRFAAGLEQGAVSAYLAAVPRFADRDLAKAAASILGDEAMHWAVLRQALGLDPVPAAFVS